MVNTDYLFAMLFIGAVYLMIYIIHGGGSPHWKH